MRRHIFARVEPVGKSAAQIELVRAVLLIDLPEHLVEYHHAVNLHHSSECV